MATTTTRLGLTKPSGSASPEEPVDIGVINTNMDILDEFSGCILVNNGVTPSAGDLFDGAIVKERTSGIIWEARENGGGGFDKIYIRYPLHFQGYKAAAQTVATSTSFVTMNIDSVNTSFCKNTSSSEIVSNRFVVPVKGIYTFYLRLGFAANATGERAIGFELNGVTVPGDEYTSTMTGASAGAAVSAKLSIVSTTLCNVGDDIGISGWQNSGGNLDTTAIFLKAALIEPIQ